MSTLPPTPAHTRTDHRNAKLHNNLGLLLKDRGDVQGALSPLREAVRLAPSYSRAYYNLGNAAFRLGLR